MWGGEYATVRVRDPPLCPQVPEPKRHRLQTRIFSSAPPQMPRAENAFQNDIITKPVYCNSQCVYGAKIIPGSQRCGVLPLPLYFLHLDQHPMAPSRTSAHPSQPTLPPRILSGSRWIFLLPMKWGKARLKRQCQGAGRRDGLPFPSALAFEIARCAHCL